MKYASILFFAIYSISAFAQKADIAKTSLKDFLQMDASRISSDIQETGIYEYYQNREIITYTYGTGSIFSKGPRCKTLPGAKKLKGMSLNDISFKMDGTDSSVVKNKVTGETVALCWNAYKKEDLDLVFPTETTRDAYAIDIPEKVTITGVTDEENPDAIIRVNGYEELIPCNNLMFEYSRNGDLETGVKVFAQDIGQVVEVLALGKKYARTKDRDFTTVTSVNNLVALKPNPNFQKDEEVFISINGNKQKGKFQGEILETPKGKYVVKVRNETYVVDKVIKVIQSKQ